jgi:hypoxanthine-DNA glycosylase
MLQGFPQVSSEDTQKLILGSMPGKSSLAIGQYYAHSRNCFWQIMGEVYGASPELPYRQRLDILLRNRIGLWNVISRCQRSTSLDSDIEAGSVVANDFAGFFEEHPQIQLICFNGRKAQEIFIKHMKKLIVPSTITLCLLPSTSPANTGLTFDQKLAAWRDALQEEVAMPLSGKAMSTP